MVKLVAVVGCKKSGKTSLIEALLEVFIRKGYRVGAMKNSHHTLETDSPGTDSWRLREAGASRVMLTWPGGAAVPFFDIRENDTPQYLAELCMADLDLVILEGFRNSPLPKILIRGSEKDFAFNTRGLFATVREKAGSPGEPGTIGPSDAESRLAHDTPHERLEIPCFDPDDVEGIAGRIEERFHWNKRSNPMNIELRVDGKKIGLKGFVRDIVASTITAMVKTLKGCGDPGKIEITIDHEGTEEK